MCVEEFSAGAAEVVSELTRDIGCPVDVFGIGRKIWSGIQAPCDSSCVWAFGDDAGTVLARSASDHPIVDSAGGRELVDVGESALGPIPGCVMHLDPGCGLRTPWRRTHLATVGGEGREALPEAGESA